jgi:hypothetical protein
MEMKFAAKIFIGFLPYEAFESNNRLCHTAPHIHEKEFTFVTDTLQNVDCSEDDMSE